MVQKVKPNRSPRFSKRTLLFVSTTTDYNSFILLEDNLDIGYYTLYSLRV